MGREFYSNYNLKNGRTTSFFKHSRILAPLLTRHFHNRQVDITPLELDCHEFFANLARFSGQLAKRLII
jgi:hypothetical protein